MTAFFRMVAVVVAAVSALATAGAIAAAAPDYSGQTYGKAAEAIAGTGYKAVIAGAIGDQLATNDCIVTRSTLASGNLDASGRSRGSQILLYLNCNAAIALPGQPGNSAASAAGKAGAKDLETAKYCSNPDHAGNSDCDKFCSTRAALCDQGAKQLWLSDLETAQYCAVAEHAGNPDCGKFCASRADVCDAGAKMVYAKDLETAEYCADAEHAGNSDCAKFCSLRAQVCEDGAKIVYAKDLETAKYCQLPAQAGNSDCAKFCSLRAQVCDDASRQVAGSAGWVVPTPSRSQGISAALVLYA